MNPGMLFRRSCGETVSKDSYRSNVKPVARIQHFEWHVCLRVCT